MSKCQPSPNYQAFRKVLHEANPIQHITTLGVYKDSDSKSGKWSADELQQPVPLAYIAERVAPTKFGLSYKTDHKESANSKKNYDTRITDSEIAVLVNTLIEHFEKQFETALQCDIKLLSTTVVLHHVNNSKCIGTPWCSSGFI